jgi:ribonuclease P protein component
MAVTCFDDAVQKAVLDSPLLLTQSNPVKIVDRQGQEEVSLSAPLPPLSAGTGRLTCKAQFDRVFGSSRKRVKKEVVLLAAPAPLQEGVSAGRRLGLVVSRKVGNAVCRNLIKRRLRAIFRQLPPTLGADQDVVVIARPLIRESGYAELQRSVTSALSSLVRNPPST